MIYRKKGSEISRSRLAGVCGLMTLDEIGRRTNKRKERGVERTVRTSRSIVTVPILLFVQCGCRDKMSCGLLVG